jgi:hypothetical protein
MYYYWGILSLMVVTLKTLNDSRVMLLLVA